MNASYRRLRADLAAIGIAVGDVLTLKHKGKFTIFLLICGHSYRTLPSLDAKGDLGVIRDRLDPNLSLILLTMFQRDYGRSL